MQLTTLVKALLQIQADHPRALVLVDWESFKHPDHDCVAVKQAEGEWVNWSDGDGVTENKDGSERQRFCVVLKGRSRD